MMVRLGVLLAAIAAVGAVAPNYAPPPGALNPMVTQANISATICVRGWTRTVRPPAAYTATLKRQQIAERHYTDTNPAHYEEDHLIPLELGGHPTSRINLWPQPLAQALVKDRLELALNKAVCSGRMLLRDAQEQVKDPRRWR